LKAVEPHTVNGKVVGAWHHHPSGLVYVAYRRRRQIHRGKQGWLIEALTLSRCRDLKVKAVVVDLITKGRPMRWATLLSDFEGEHAFTCRAKGERYMGLPLHRFRIDPAASEQHIERTMRVR
jgi:hypothetical protein